MSHAVVCGAGGFIGSHLVSALRSAGYWVRGVDIKRPEYSPSHANEFLLLDLRDEAACHAAVNVKGVPSVEVYNLAADMGGMGFIHSAESDIMRNNALININMAQAASAHGVSRYFFSSSVCVYRDMAVGEPPLTEEDAYPAAPDNEYGWEKLYAERVALAFGRRHNMAVRIARFQNCYGPEGTWQGGREKAPAAICRKVAAAPDGGEIEVWGDGSAVRSYIYVADLVQAIVALMHSSIAVPTNIGIDEYVSVSDLVGLVARIANKKLSIRYVDGPVGVQSRNFSHERICSLGWRPKYTLEAGLRETYPWVEAQHQLRSSEVGTRS